MYDSLDKDFLIGQILMDKKKIIHKTAREKERERDRQTDRGKERKRERNAERKRG